MLTIYKYSGDPMFLHLQSFKIYSFGSELSHPLGWQLQPHTTPLCSHELYWLDSSYPKSYRWQQEDKQNEKTCIGTEIESR